MPCLDQLSYFHILLFPQCCQMVSVVIVCVFGASSVLSRVLELFFLHNRNLSHTTWSKDAVANYHEHVVNLILVLILWLLVVVFLVWFAIHKGLTKQLKVPAHTVRSHLKTPGIHRSKTACKAKGQSNMAMAFFFVIMGGGGGGGDS